MRTSRIASFVLGLLLLAPVVSAEDVKNPFYTGWAKFAVGSSATLTARLDIEGRILNLQLSGTLAGKSDDRVNVDVVTVTDIPGTPRKTESYRSVSRAMMDKKNVAELGIEEVEAAGQTINCKVFEITGVDPKRPEAKTTLWMNRTIPGGIVKMRYSSGMGTATFVLQRYEAK